MKEGNLLAELLRIGERLEIQLRHIEVIRQKLSQAYAGTGTPTADLVVSDAILPLNGRPSLAVAAGNGEEPRYPAPSRRTATAKDLGLHEDWWPSSARRVGPMTPTAGWRNYTVQRTAQKVVGISVCGLSPQQIDATVSAILVQLTRQRDFIPVFLTDSKYFEAFRHHGFVWEYLPGAEERARYHGATSWAEYAAARRALLERKWGLDYVVCIGDSEFGVLPPSHEALSPDPDPASLS